MTQTIFPGTAGADSFDASAEGATDIAVFRGLGAGDQARGGAGNDRFSIGSVHGAVLDGGAGRDQFCITLGNQPGGPADSIDGGAGVDELIITLNGNQLTAAVGAEFARLGAYIHAGDIATAFDSDLLHIGMQGVEVVRLRVDGVLTTLDQVIAGPTAAADSFSGTEDTPLAVDAAHGLLANDAGAGLMVAAGSFTTALGGSVTVAADGSFAYAPAADAQGSDSFAYTVTDALGRTATATASIALAAGSGGEAGAMTVGDLFGGYTSGQNNLAGAAAGIALTSLPDTTGEGHWQVKLAGGDWATLAMPEIYGSADYHWLQVPTTGVDAAYPSYNPLVEAAVAAGTYKLAVGTDGVTPFYVDESGAADLYSASITQLMPPGSPYLTEDYEAIAGFQGGTVVWGWDTGTGMSSHFSVTLTFNRPVDHFYWGGINGPVTYSNGPYITATFPGDDGYLPKQYVGALLAIPGTPEELAGLRIIGFTKHVDGVDYPQIIQVPASGLFLPQDAELRFVPDAGYTGAAPALTAKLVAATSDGSAPFAALAGLGASDLTHTASGSVSALDIGFSLLGNGILAVPLTGFTQGTGQIDLRGIDADPTTAGVQGFSFIGTAAFSGGAQVRYAYDAAQDRTLVELDTTDANLAANMAFVVAGHPTLTAADFLL